uniref:Interleukin 22 receptor, alpha 2 n=1 Tax=Gasterosteus aculeatus aculeatus TaxID=481459 RepID=A0AAQ4R145_GASAC
MTDLLLRVVLLGNLGATGPAPLMLAAPTGVRFDSVDYRNVVHWTPASNSCSLQYHVQWKIYGEPQWLDAPGCQRIHKTRCDLSAVTSDPREWYYARVHASCRPSGKTAWALSPRFSPRWDTEISPPVLRLEVTKRGIVVRVKPPRLTVRKKHGDLLHEIYLIHPGGRESHEATADVPAVQRRSPVATSTAADINNLTIQVQHFILRSIKDPTR